MKQLFLWFMTGVFAAWALYAAYQLAGGWAAAVKRAGPWADRTHVAWPTEVTQQMLVVVLGLLSAIGFAAFAADNRWEQRLRNNSFKARRFHPKSQ